MFARLSRNALVSLATMAVAAWSFGWGAAAVYAQCGGSHGSSCGGGHAGHAAHAGHGSGSARHEHGVAPANRDELPPIAPHGGQLTKAEPLNFEVVYLPHEVRVYLYGLLPYPESA